MANVLIGTGLFFAAMAHTSDESSPPERRNPTFCVRDQPFFHSRDQLLADIPAGCLQIIMADRIHLRDIGITDEPAVLIVMPGRERHDLFGQPHQVFRLAGKEDDPLFIEAVIQRPNPDGIPRGNISAGVVIINDAGKFRIQHSEHFCPVLPVQREVRFRSRCRF